MHGVYGGLETRPVSSIITVLTGKIKRLSQSGQCKALAGVTALSAPVIGVFQFHPPPAGKRQLSELLLADRFSGRQPTKLVQVLRDAEKFIKEWLTAKKNVIS